VSEPLAIPHRAPVVLVERVVSRDATQATAEMTVREPWLRDGALAPEALVEALAQTCAVYAQTDVARQGVLAKLNDFTFPARAREGERVTLVVRLQTRVGPLAAFESSAQVGDRIVARGELRVAWVP
jgi:predicted hotdog family 3-hydroxylacyl-ACP dehydratase